MRINFFTVIFLTLVFIIFNHQLSASNLDELIYKIKNLSESTNENYRFQKHLANFLLLDRDYLSYKHNTEFNCKRIEYTTGKPVTIDTLKPSDIRVVAALGDSLTAGLGAGASNIVELLLEYRGLAFSIGGDKDINTILTVPNILKEFSNNLTGFSTGKTRLYDHNGDNLNRAISGSQAFNLLEQAKKLTQMVFNSNEIDFWNDWKLVTVFIGANDICESCKGRKENLPDIWIGFIKETLDYLQKSLPRTFVNLVSVLDVALVRTLNHNEFCREIHKFECDCAAFPANDQAEENIVELFNKYTLLTKELVESGRYDTTDDFVVVLQPFLTNFTTVKLPDGSVDITYFAPDCFHFSAKTHALAAISLWNNMLEPVGFKQQSVSFNKTIICPSVDRPYLFTKKNSVNYVN